MSEKIDLSTVYMCELCNEIEGRPDVKTVHVEPYETIELPPITGAATVYIVANQYSLS